MIYVCKQNAAWYFQTCESYAIWSELVKNPMTCGKLSMWIAKVRPIWIFSLQASQQKIQVFPGPVLVVVVVVVVAVVGCWLLVFVCCCQKCIYKWNHHQQDEVVAMQIAQMFLIILINLDVGQMLSYPSVSVPCSEVKAKHWGLTTIHGFPWGKGKPLFLRGGEVDQSSFLHP